MRLVVPDLVSPSYFPAIAAVQLGCIAEYGVDVTLDLHFPVTSAVSALRDGEVDFVAGSAHALFHRAPDGGGIKLLAALSRNMYWFLVVRSDLGLLPGVDLTALSGLRIGAAPGPDDALIQLLVDAGVDLGSVDIGPVPGALGAGVSFGVTAAEALAARQIDGFWANGMGAEVAVRSGNGTVLIDGRRGGGPSKSQHYTFAGLMTTARLEEEQPSAVWGVVAGLIDAQRRLKLDPELARDVAVQLFPPMEADLAATLIERDAPYYSPEIGPNEIASMVEFAQCRGMTTLDLKLEDLVSVRYRELWDSSFSNNKGI